MALLKCDPRKKIQNFISTMEFVNIVGYVQRIASNKKNLIYIFLTHPSLMGAKKQSNYSIQ